MYVSRVNSFVIIASTPDTQPRNKLTPRSWFIGSVHPTHGAARWVVVVMIYVFAIAYSGGWAVGFQVYISEIQPAKTRATASSLSRSSNWVSLISSRARTKIF